MVTVGDVVFLLAYFQLSSSTDHLDVSARPLPSSATEGRYIRRLFYADV